jgi:hypothetical protein
MVAPRMLGPQVRRCYLEGVGFITAIGIQLVEDQPNFVPMRREERGTEERYNERPSIIFRTLGASPAPTRVEKGQLATSGF